MLARPAVRRVLLLSFAIRVPMWAGNVILTLHVVTTLGHSYAASGVVVAAATVALSLSAPWRGRLLDRHGLRATVTPSLVVLTVCWSIAPFGNYALLLVLATVAGLFVVPTFSIIRQALMAVVDEGERKTALSIDSVVVELSFMIGPAIGVLLATYWQTSWAMFTCELASVVGGLVLWLVNPRMRSGDDAGADHDHRERRGWVSAPVLVVLAMAVAATLVLSGTDVGVVAAMRDFGDQAAIGWVLLVWGLGSAVGGLLYGAMTRTVPVAVMLAFLAAATLPAALATGPVTTALLLFVAGFFCAPTITATVDTLSRLVPEHRRGEAMGWHGGAMTAGSAAGAPIAGVAIDHTGWQGGFWLPAAVSLAIALVGLRFVRVNAAAPGEPLEPPDDGPVGALDGATLAAPPAPDAAVAAELERAGPTRH